MALQQGRDIPVHFKAQAALGTEEAGGSGATKLLYKEGSQGFSPEQAVLIESATNYADGMTTRGRRGTYNVPGQYVWEAIVGAHDLLYPTFFRNDYDAAGAVDQDDLSSATISVASNVITASAGSFLTAGVRVLDLIKFGVGLDASDNGKWLRVKAVTATTITVYDTITNVAGPVSTWAFVICKKLLQSNLTKLFTFEQYYQQLDQSLVISDVKGGQINFALTENSTLDVTADFLATQNAIKASGSSPHFTSPTEPDGNALAFLDAAFSINGGDVLTVTGFNIAIDLATQTIAVANRTGKSPDVFQGNGKPTGQFSMAPSDFALLSAAAAETQIDFLATFYDPNGDDVFALGMTNCIMTSEALSPIGSDGATITTFGLEAGRDGRGGAFDRTGVKLMSSAA